MVTEIEQSRLTIYGYSINTLLLVCRKQGRRKHLKIGGSPASRGTVGYWKGQLNNFSRKCWRGGGGERNFPKLQVLDQFFFLIWKFSNKKGTFDVNLVFTATLACTKRAFSITNKGNFHHKKWHFLSFEKIWGACAPMPPPPVPPLLRRHLVVLTLESRWPDNLKAMEANSILKLLIYQNNEASMLVASRHKPTRKPKIYDVMSVW
jgi:hypothetical protein